MIGQKLAFTAAHCRRATSMLVAPASAMPNSGCAGSTASAQVKALVGLGISRGDLDCHRLLLDTANQMIENIARIWQCSLLPRCAQRLQKALFTHGPASLGCAPKTTSIADRARAEAV